jgi:hypothetical protein
MRGFRRLSTLTADNRSLLETLSSITWCPRE